LVYGICLLVMNTHAEQVQESRTQATANVVGEKKDVSSIFVDNRPGSVAQRKLQAAINTIPRTQQLKADTEAGEKEVIVEDKEENLLPGQLKKSDFLNKLYAELYSAGTQEYKGTNLTVEGCPYIQRWFSIYQNSPSEHIYRALLKYARASSVIGSADQLIALIIRRARLGFKTQAKTGQITELPLGISENFGKGIVPEPKKIIQRKEKELKSVLIKPDVAQLGCFTGGDGGGAAPAPLAPAPLAPAIPAAPVYNFLPWGAAVTVGYKGKEPAFWAGVVANGAPQWSDGLLGPGFYTTLTTNDGLANFYSHAANGIVMEVGYIGGLAGLNIVDIANTDDYDDAVHDAGVDVLRVPNAIIGQLCFKNTGPAAINLANFRFRPY